MPARGRAESAQEIVAGAAAHLNGAPDLPVTLRASPRRPAAPSAPIGPPATRTTWMPRSSRPSTRRRTTRSGGPSWSAPWASGRRSCRSGGLQLAQADPLLAVEDIAPRPDRLVPNSRARLGSGAFLGVRLEHSSVQHGGRPGAPGHALLQLRPARGASRRPSARQRAGLAGLADAGPGQRPPAGRDGREPGGGPWSGRRAGGAAAGGDARGRRGSAGGGVRAGGRGGGRPAGGRVRVAVARFESRAGGAGRLRGAPARTRRHRSPRQGGGALAQVARSGRVARVDDYEALGRRPGGTAGSRRRVSQRGGCPVRVGGHLWGALLARHHRGRAHRR